MRMFFNRLIEARSRRVIEDILTNYNHLLSDSVRQRLIKEYLEKTAN